MSIRTSFNPMGTLGGVELLDGPTAFDKTIEGVTLDGATSSDSQHWEIEAWFDFLKIENTWTAYYYLYELYTSPTQTGRCMVYTEKYGTSILIENNTEVYSSLTVPKAGYFLHGNHIKVSGREVVMNSYRTTARNVVYTQGVSPVRPVFLKGASYSIFALERFLFKVDGVVAQEYLPAKLNGELGLYETKSKTFCK